MTAIPIPSSGEFHGGVRLRISQIEHAYTLPDSNLHLAAMDIANALLTTFQAPAFTAAGTAVSWLEITAFVTALAMVVCNMRVLTWAWPLAMLSSMLYGVLFYQGRMYGETGLQVVFVVFAAWGWHQWLRGQAADGTTLTVRSLPGGARWRLIALTAIGWPVIGFSLAHFTDTDVAWLDALPTAGSLAGQWLLARKYVENWVAWILVNVFSLALFAYKSLWLTVLLYALFLLLAVMGWRAWRRLERQSLGITPA